MSNELIPYSDVEKMGIAIAKSKLFGMKTPEEAIALMLVAQSEGLHPVSAARDYNIILGKPALKSDAMLARFQHAGGSVDWEAMTDERVSGKFSHPQACPKGVLIDWDIKRATVAGFAGKDNWKKFPRQMLRARVISEGVRACYPASCAGVYTPEEVQDFVEEPKPVKAVVKEEPKKAEFPDQRLPVQEAETIESDLSKMKSENPAENLTPEEAAKFFGGKFENPMEKTTAAIPDGFRKIIVEKVSKKEITKKDGTLSYKWAILEGGTWYSKWSDKEYKDAPVAGDILVCSVKDTPGKTKEGKDVVYHNIDEINEVFHG